VHVVPDANHVLSLVEWQEEMFGVAESWVRQHFSDDLAAPAPPAAGVIA
jgi:hypothetical protein